ncbi:uncharacterized protein LOC135162626 [Diachasmimorpha longicaudata]|uniref:uncharacterized protein LOC135162626 n=1 Tax=Diachasmimorpha longicaudata TaxID=58733 RepID=UPI0030B90645
MSIHIILLLAIEESPPMALLKENFLSLHYFGIWPSVDWRPRTWKPIVYSLYTCYIIFSIYWFTISGSVYLLLISDDIEDFSDTSFMLLSMLAICAKVIIAISKRSEIIDVLTALENHPHKPVNLETQLLQDRADGRIRFYTIGYGGITEVTVCYGTIAPFFQNIPYGFLPYKAWTPYNYSSPAIYWCTYCQQLISVFFAANLNIGFDTIIFGILIQICTQFNMLKCRLRMMIEEFDAKQIMMKSVGDPMILRTYEKYMSDYIKYHIAIFRISEKINSLFNSIIFVQYSASVIIICVSVLLASQMPVSSPKFMTVAMYVACMLLQIFMFCAAGNEATLECESLITAIYNTKWYLLTPSMKKCLGLMMLRTLRPIIFVSNHIVVLSLESFCIVRLSLLRNDNYFYKSTKPRQLLLSHSYNSNQGIDMALLRESFLSLQYCGIWPPLHLDSGSWQYRAYFLYTIYVGAVMYWFTLSELINLLFTPDDVQDFSDNCFMLLTTAAVCAKIFIILKKRSEIRDVPVALESYPHKPMNVEEQKIQDEYDGHVRFLTLFYGVATEITVWGMTIFTFFQEIPFGVLPYKAWIPYDYSEPSVYWFTYYQQLLSVLFAAHLNIGFDTIFPGFMLQICAQFNILKCRLHRIVNHFDDVQCLKGKSSDTLELYENHLIDCIKYHRDIFELADKINSIFTSIIFVQYSASLIIICVSVLLISQMPVFSPKFFALFLYLSCMLLQIFMFCATGNEATVQCQGMINAISGTKWYFLRSHIQKYLVLMMVRTLRPVRFVSGYIMVLSLDSFCVLVKMSYSTYTVLQRSSS